jgi:hypothetical protein
MDNLSLMFQNGMGPLASLNMGRQMVADKQMAAEDLKAKQLANQNTATMNPLNAQFRQGQIAEQQAQLPGIVGDSQVKASAGQTEAATTGAKIAQRLSSLSNQVGVDKMQALGREGEIALKAAQVLKQYPPSHHKEVLSQAMQAFGGDPNSPLIAGVMKMPDAEVQKSLEALGTGMSMASSDYMQKSALQDSQNKSHERIADTNAAAQIYTAKINAASRESAAKARASAVKHMNSDQAFNYLASIPDSERTPDEQAWMEKVSKQRLAERAAGANAVAPTVLNQATPTQNALNTASQITNPQASAPPPSADVGNMAKQAWGAYEPDKYQYRVGPNGKLQRAPLR